MVCNIGPSKSIHIRKKDPRNIKGHISLTDNHRILAACQIRLEVSVFREAVVPSNKGTGRMYAAQSFLTRNTQLLVLRRPVREQNRIVVWLQYRQRQVMADIDITNKIEARGCCDFSKTIFAVLLFCELESAGTKAQDDMDCANHLGVYTPLPRDDPVPHHSGPNRKGLEASHTYQSTHCAACLEGAKQHKNQLALSPQWRRERVLQRRSYWCCIGVEKSRCVTSSVHDVSVD